MKHILLTAVFAAAALTAGMIDVTLAPSTLDGAGGAILTFRGTLANHSGVDVYLTGASLTLAGLPVDSIDLTGFMVNTPLVLVTGATTGAVDLFTVTIPVAFAAGQYAGSLVVQGGEVAGADAEIGSTGFEVVVREGAGTQTPEPATLFLVGAALAVGAQRWQGRNVKVA
jgi:hypothetical protein